MYDCKCYLSDINVYLCDIYLCNMKITYFHRNISCGHSIRRVSQSFISEIEKNEIEAMENTNDTEFLKDSSSNLEENKKTIKTTTYNTNTISTDNTQKYNKNTLQPSKNNELKKINNNFIKSSQKLFETDNTNEENNIDIIENDKTRKKNIFTKILDMLMMIATYLHLPPIEQ